MTPPRFLDHPAHLAALQTAALQAVEPAAAVQRALTPADLHAAERVFIVGAGKAGGAMAQAAAEWAGTRLAGGLMAVPQQPPHSTSGVTFMVGGHPLPDNGSLAAGQALLSLLQDTRPADLVLALISGGGSALLESLQPGLALSDLQTVNAALLRCGATIHEINPIRKRLSQLKGGGLARRAAPAKVLGLILSDVVGNDLGLVASGPTTPATEAPGRALAIVRRYGLEAELPDRVLQILSEERPAADEAWPPVENRLIGSNRLAGQAAARAAEALGFEAHYLADDWQGEARAVGQRLSEQVLLARRAGGPAQALIAGGESTVIVRGPGRGGRNQEAALAAALALADQPAVVVSTLATDGVDGPTDAAGATITGATISQARALGLDPQASLDANDAYSFFTAAGGLVRTGPTGTNVNDLFFGLIYEPPADV